MSVIVEIALVLVIIAILYALLAPTLGRRRESGGSLAGPAGSPAEIESVEAYRNHLAMARWIELQLKDDLVRSSVAEEEQVRAKRLLDEFYGDDR
jgi:hypothetical protein